MEAGKARLKGDETRGATRAEVEQLQRENERLRELVANLSLETLVLKKSLL
jgi:transposase